MMESNKMTRIVTAVGLVAILLVLPLKIAVGNAGFYYAAVALVAIAAGFKLTEKGRSDERFYRRWEKKKQSGKWGIVLAEAIKSLILLAVIVALALMLLGGSPEQTLSELSPGMRAGMAALLIAFAVVLGFGNFQEKNRRFERLRAQFRG
ncbi:hypothetical protein [Saccharibacillus alkalitolerans]|uniref:Uncharacterized protein n=1 Tax=Saccharibacillus alkalitolerans TaxID=2705290 RepID=A0ABX0FAV0_9BACL|nr:hypothetical protein [Saccharibacillus alkalitolerans]NGZ77085.1 hypothetical protein [Saccharibacillus alkalitolerans]